MAHKLQIALDSLTRIAGEIEACEEAALAVKRNLAHHGSKGKAVEHVHIALKYLALARSRIIDARVKAEFGNQPSLFKGE